MWDRGKLIMPAPQTTIVHYMRSVATVASVAGFSGKLQMEENTAIELTQEDGEILVDSRIIAKGIGVEHESFMKTIYTYQSELEEFGVLRFQIGKPPEGSTGGRPEKYVLLNRDQIGVATSLSRNTKKVVRFKVDLFHRIDAMEQTILQLRDPAGQLAAYQEENERLRQLYLETVEEGLAVESVKGLGMEDTWLFSVTMGRVRDLNKDAETALKAGKFRNMLDTMLERNREIEKLAEFSVQADNNNVATNFKFNEQDKKLEKFHKQAKNLLPPARKEQQKQIEGPEQGE